MFINNLFQEGDPAGGDRAKWKSTFIRDNVSIDSNSTILLVEICENVMTGAGSMIIKNITKPEIYAGNPA